MKLLTKFSHTFKKRLRAIILRCLPDKQYLKYIYYKKMNKKLNLINPRTFNEKMQYLKLFDRNPKYTQLVDKYAVRSYISNLIGEEYLIPLIGVYENFNQIDFSKLPNQFVLKCTHDSGGVVLCNDKRLFDKKTAESKINSSLKRNYYYYWREWPYKNVQPKIVCEKYMVNESTTGLMDYKFMCFNGKVKCSFVCLNRNSENGLNVDFYDINWKPLPFERHYPKSNSIIPRPHNYSKMIELAEILSKGTPFLRVDFYEIDNKIYFGELTFYPGSGLEAFTPESYDYLLGEWIDHTNHS